MLRITEENVTDNSKTLRLEGRLVNQWIEVLRSSCEQSVQSKSRLILDLADLSFADYKGMQLLRRLEQQQVTFINCSPFLREQLKQSTNSISPGGPASE